MLKGLSEINAIKLSRKHLNQYVGTYQMNENSFIKIAREGKQVILERTRSLDKPGMKMNLLPYEQNKFWSEGQELRCVFNSDDDQDFQSLTIYFGETSLTANRLK